MIIALEKLFLWEKNLWFSLRSLLFYLLRYLGSMVAGQVTEKFVTACSENR